MEFESITSSKPEENKVTVFLKELEELSLKHKIVLNGWVADCKPSALGLPGHGDFNVFMQDLRKLYLKHMLFIDCFVPNDLMVPYPFTDEEDIDEIRLDEMIEFGLTEWTPELRVFLQTYELELGMIIQAKQNSEEKGSG